MADSLKNRVGRVIAGGVHALIDRLEDQAPEAMMEQSLREAESVIDDVRHELGQVSANRHLAQQQHASLNRQHETLTAQVAEAMRASREDLAHAAISRQLDIEAQLPVLLHCCVPLVVAVQVKPPGTTPLIVPVYWPRLP